MTLQEIYNGIEELSPKICKDMEGTCDECPFGVWSDKEYCYECGFQLFQCQIENYQEQEKMYK